MVGRMMSLMEHTPAQEARKVNETTATTPRPVAVTADPFTVTVYPGIGGTFSVNVAIDGRTAAFLLGAVGADGERMVRLLDADTLTGGQIVARAEPPFHGNEEREATS